MRLRNVGLHLVLALGLLGAPLSAGAQQPAKAHRIGFLGAASPSAYASLLGAFRQGLRDLGYVEGKTVTIEDRWAEGNYDRLPDLAAELVRLKVDVILTHGTPGTLAAKRATTTIPIVMAVSGDAVATGIVASVARPGGNITGSTYFFPELNAKRVDLLKQALPRIVRVAALSNPDNPAAAKRENPSMAKRVKPIPHGYHSVTPYLTVRNADRAIDFYKRAFAARELMRMHGPDGKSLVHAEIKIGDSIVFLHDEFLERGHRSPESLGGASGSIFLYVADVDAAFKRAVETGAQVRMPLADMFWGDRYGQLADPFGHEWRLATHKEDLTPEEIGRRSSAAFKGGASA